MPLPLPDKAWALFMSDPVTFLTVLGVVVSFVATFTWFLRGHIGKERVATLEERLRLAADNQTTIERQVATLEAENSKQAAIISELNGVGGARVQADKLSSANSTVKNVLTDLAQATTNLGVALTPVRFGPPGPRQFTDQTAHDLLALYDGRTPLQADEMIARYKGCWIRVHGQVVNILPDGRPNHSVAVLKENSRVIECRLGPEWNEQAKKLNKGDLVNLQGKISEHQNGSQLYLLECEIV